LLLSEQKSIVVVERIEGTILEPDRLALTRVPGANKVHLFYKWMDGDIEKVLHISINSPTIIPDDLSADLSMWNGEARESIRKIIAEAEKELHDSEFGASITPIIKD